MADALQDTIDLLSANWDSSNTDSKTPNFHKITDFKRWDFNTNTDVIFIHRPRVLQEPAGIGVLGKHLTYTFDVDIRVIGPDREAHWLRVIDEVKRIFDTKIKNPNSDFNILDPDSDAIDLSDKGHNLWRFQMPMKFIKYNTARP